MKDLKDLRDLIVYCDMDGVLADFNAEPNAVERFRNEKGFFKNLKPILTNCIAISLLINEGAKVYILSASPNKQADKDKIKWLKKFMPDIKKENYIFIRNGQNKSDFVREKGILFDDYGKNVNQWKEKGLKAYKIDNIYNIIYFVKNLRNTLAY